MMLNSHQEDLLALLDSYNPGWRDAGCTFCEMLGAGIADGARDVERQMLDIMAQISNMQPTIQAPQLTGGVHLQGNMPGSNMSGGGVAERESKFETDMRGIMTAVSDSVEAVKQAVGQVAPRSHSLTTRCVTSSRVCGT